MLDYYLKKKFTKPQIIPIIKILSHAKPIIMQSFWVILFVQNSHYFILLQKLYFSFEAPDKNVP
jgi:hypothetical protein